MNLLLLSVFLFSNIRSFEIFSLTRICVLWWYLKTIHLLNNIEFYIYIIYQNVIQSATLSNVSITNPSYVVRVSNNGILKATGTDNTNISLSGTKEGTGYWYNVMDMTGGQVTLGDESTQNVNITAEGGNPTGVIAYTGGSKVNITGKDVHITAHGDTYAAGIHAQSNDVTRANPSAININADNTVIDVSTDKATFDGGENQAIGIISYSGSTVNISGNLTVNAPTVISTRGNSEVNINQDGKGTVKLNGDISFNYNDSTSGTGIDSNVNINLTDADSVLNGNVMKTGNAPSEKATVDKMTLSLSIMRHGILPQTAL